MKWKSLNDSGQLEEIVAESKTKPVLIYKHSTRCNISRAALDRLERKWDSSAVGDVQPYLLDLLAYRTISGQIADIFEVEHESPQILLISEGKAVLDLSHFDIDFERIKTACSPPPGGS